MLLQIENLSVSVVVPQGLKRIVHDLSLSIDEQRIVGLVGGSGSGKTTTGLAILRLLMPPLTVDSGRITFNGKDLLRLPAEAIRKIRGQEIAMVFQEPLNAMNPVFTVGQQIAEVLSAHGGPKGRRQQEEVYELLRQVDIQEPKRVAKSYPHQLSGGMRQRAMIAQAIALRPKLIIADEPTSNLDVTVQARIAELFLRLCDEKRMSILLITHDLGLVQHLADEVAVMHEGVIIERGPVGAVLHSPKQAYTKELMQTIV